VDPIWIPIVFVLGFGVSQIGLPPLVGYLIAGFVLKALGVQEGESLDRLSDLGVILLLFSIGLKLKLKSLASPEVWATATIHMLITILLFTGFLFGMGLVGISIFTTLDFSTSLLIAFALSFSSTVFAVKALESRKEMESLHGRISIGILIMQDIFAVIFLTLSMGKYPTIWAIWVLFLPFLRPAFFYLLERCGYGEMLILFGLFMSLIVGAGGFSAVGLKADLGALVIGIVLANHPKASQLADSLLGFKDLFLIGFFLSIGLSGLPTWSSFGIACILTVVMVIKFVLFYYILTRFRLRARTSTVTSLSLATYSEFGLIVAFVATEKEWIDNEWMIIIAIALSLTYLIAAPLNHWANSIYSRYREWLIQYESKNRLPYDQPIEPGDAEIAIFGMGRIGRAAYDALNRQFSNRVIGVDFNEETVTKHREQGKNIILGDATDTDFWERTKPGKIHVVLLAMSSFEENLEVAEFLKIARERLQRDYYVASLVGHDEEIDELEQAGVNDVFNVSSEAGSGFANHVIKSISSRISNDET
jgi:glutathione-regulated potassium-efflux system ancillary protein KefC